MFCFSPLFRLTSRCCRHWAPRCKNKKHKITTQTHLPTPHLMIRSFPFYELQSPDFSAVDMSLPCFRASVLHRDQRVQCFRASGCHSDVGVTGDQEPEERHTVSVKSISPSLVIFMLSCFTTLNQCRFKVFFLKVSHGMGSGAGFFRRTSKFHLSHEAV